MGLLDDPDETLRCIQAQTSEALNLHAKGLNEEAFAIIRRLDKRLPPALPRHRRILGLKLVK